MPYKVKFLQIEVFERKISRKKSYANKKKNVLNLFKKYAENLCMQKFKVHYVCAFAFT